LQTSSISQTETPYIPRDDESEAAFYARQTSGVVPPRTLDPDDVRLYHMQDLGLMPDIPDFSDVSRKS
jgi:hypothetical protein